VRIHRLLLTLTALIAAVVLAAVTGPARAQGPVRRFALLVGIGDYQAPEIRDLPHAAADAAELGKTLEANGFLTTVVGTPVTKARILAAVQEIGRQAQPGDLLVVFLSGRGVTLPGVGGGAFFLPQDLVPKDGAAIRAGSLSAKELKAAIDGVKASRRILLADIGRAPVFTGTGPLSQLLPREGFNRELALERRPDTTDPTEMSLSIFAAGAGKPAHDLDPEKRGVFGYYAARGFSAEDDPKALDASGRLTVMSLVRYLRSEPATATKDRPGGPQQPEVFIQGGGPDFLLVDPVAVAARKGPQPLQDPVIPAETPPTSRFALVIGMSEYRSLPVVPSAQPDAQAFQTLLTTQLNFPRDQVLFIENQQIGRPELLGAVKTWLAKIRPGSVVVVFYAGHGRAVDNDDYLVFPPADSFPEYVEQTSIAADQLLERIDQRRPAQITAFLDMCRDMGAAGPGTSAFRPSKRLATAARTDVYYACSETENARDSRETPNRGVFTDFLLKAFRGDPRAVGRRGQVTFDSLRSYLRDSVSAYVLQVYGGAQRPDVISRVPNVAVAAARPPEPPDYRRTHVDSNRPLGVILPDPAAPFNLGRLEKRVLSGHTAAIKAMAFATDGGTNALRSDARRLLASVSPKELCVWDVAEAKNRFTVTPGGVVSPTLAFAPDGKSIAFAVNDGTIRIHNTEDGKELHKLQGHSNYISSLAYSPDGRVMVSGSWDATAVIWNGVTAQRITTLTSHSRDVNMVAVSPDGLTLATASADGTARLWDTSTGTELAVLRGHRESVRTVVFSPDGTVLATGSGANDRTVRLWDGWTGRELASLAVPSSVALIAFAGNGERLVAASNKELKFWSVPSRQEAGTLQAGHDGMILTLALGPDGRTLATGGEDDDERNLTLFFWDALKGEKLPEKLPEAPNPQKLPTPIEAMAFGPDGQSFAVGTGAKAPVPYRIVLWRPAPKPAK